MVPLDLIVPVLFRYTAGTKTTHFLFVSSRGLGTLTASGVCSERLCLSELWLAPCRCAYDAREDQIPTPFIQMPMLSLRCEYASASR